MGTQQITSTYTGHLVKKVRKSMGLRQYQIVNDQITRNLVSLVENNKIPLTANAAQIIVACINTHAEEKGSPIRITEQDLRIEGIYEARLKIASYLETFDNIESEGKATIEFMIHDINVLFSQYDLPEAKAQLFSQIGQYFYQSQDYSAAILYLLKAYEATVRVSDMDHVLSSLSELVKVYLLNGEYANAVRYAKIAENITAISSTTKFQAILFNKALAFKHKEDYKRAIWEVDRIIKTWPLMPSSKQFDLKLLKAIVLKHMARYEEANELFLSLLDICDKDIDRAKVMSNMLSLYIEACDFKLLTVPIDRMREYLPHIQDHRDYLSAMLIDLALAEAYVGEMHEAKAHLDSGIALGIETKDPDLIKNALTALLSEPMKTILSPVDVLAYVEKLQQSECFTPTAKQLAHLVLYFNQEGTPEDVTRLIQLFY